MGPPMSKKRGFTGSMIRDRGISGASKRGGWPAVGSGVRPEIWCSRSGNASRQAEGGRQPRRPRLYISASNYSVSGRLGFSWPIRSDPAGIGVAVILGVEWDQNRRARSRSITITTFSGTAGAGGPRRRNVVRLCIPAHFARSKEHTQCLLSTLQYSSAGFGMRS